jgi:hypothetical protein
MSSDAPARKHTANNHIINEFSDTFFLSQTVSRASVAEGKGQPMPAGNPRSGHCPKKQRKVLGLGIGHNPRQTVAAPVFLPGSSRYSEKGSARIMFRARLSKRAIFAALVGLQSGPAAAGEIPYAVALGPNEQLSGTVYLDDSSGEVASAKGVASGVVAGEYALDGGNKDAELHSATWKLDVNLDRKSEQLRARLDTCPVSLDRCSPGNWVTLWEQ